jgi:hypothetical protein
MTGLHSDHWPLQSRIDLQDDVDYAWTTKHRTFRCSNIVLIDYAWTTKNRIFCCSNLVLVDYAWTTKNRTFHCSNLVLIDYSCTTKNRTFCYSNLVLIDYPRTTKTEHPVVLISLNLHTIQSFKHFFTQKHKQLYIVLLITLLQAHLFIGTSLQ